VLAKTDRRLSRPQGDLRERQGGDRLAEPDLRALTALRRLRHAETDAARRDLGEAVSREIALAAQYDAMGRDLDAARQISGDFDRESFAAYLGRVRAERARLAEAMREAASRTASARTLLAHRRAAETTAESALASVLAAKHATAARREQVMLEDVARVLKRAEE
jgi:hypothetical protein